MIFVQQNAFVNDTMLRNKNEGDAAFYDLGVSDHQNSCKMRQLTIFHREVANSIRLY